MTLPIDRVDLESLDIADLQQQKLKELFPEVFTEGGKIDFDKLKLTLGQAIDTGKERFGMSWAGKADCYKTIQQPSVATLVPARDESIDFDTTENLFIEGDNLEVLKLLQKSYFGKVKMIYIDPPYNTGNDFIYPDNYSENLDTYLEYTGQIDGEGRKFSTNPDTDGRFHSKWMNMMYPRLFLAKNLLREDGVIFISIDDNEVKNLRAICDEVFGEENYISDFAIVRSEGGGLAKQVVRGHDYLLAYAKSISNFEPLKRPKDIRGKIVNINGEDYWIEEDWLRKEFGKYGTCLYEEIVEYKGLEKKEEIDKGLENGDYILLPKGNGTHIVGRYRLIKEDGSKFYSIMKHLNKDGVHDLEGLGLADVFNFPKPVSLIKELVRGATFFDSKKENIILDFFSGSATTANAVMNLNMEDNGNRKFICVQLPEPCDEKSEAFKAGYQTIAEISKERIRRAAAKIKAEQTEAQAKADLFDDGTANTILDLGFRVFKLQKSNFKVWDANTPKDAEAIQQALELHIDHIDPQAEQEAILFELLLKSGFELTTPIKKLTLANKEVYSIADDALLICLDKALTSEVIREMAELNPSRVICLDEGFQDNDQLKTNAVLIMKSKGVNDFRTV